MIKKERIYLHTSRDIMLALLEGEKLANSQYDVDGMYLYLEEDGYIAEEDGAGAKACRVPITMRNGTKWWIYDGNEND